MNALYRSWLLISLTDWALPLAAVVSYGF